MEPQIDLKSFTQSKADYSLFVKKSNFEFIVVLIHVDDLLITDNSITAIESLKKFLHETFTIKDLGDAKFF